VLGLELIGGEIADTRFRIRRRVRPDDPADLGAPLSYAVEVLAADDEDLDLEPAAAALSKSRQWVLAALRAGGEPQTVKHLGTASPRPATRSSPGPSRPPSASSSMPGWPPGARKATAGPATGHPPPRTPASTMAKSALVKQQECRNGAGRPPWRRAPR
jgi:hypothetical protein